MKRLLLIAAALLSQSAFSQGVTSDKILLDQSVARPPQLAQAPMEITHFGSGIWS